MVAAIAFCSSLVLAPTKCAAEAEISPEIADSRSASVISGTSRFAMPWTPDSVAENDVMATAAAATVMIDTAAKATCSLILIPKPSIHAGSLDRERRSSRGMSARAAGPASGLVRWTDFIGSPRA
jgi:hypothetical protein